MKRAPLVRKGTPSAYALSVALRTHALRRGFQRCRRAVWAEYGRDEPMLELLLGRYEERLEALETTSEALMTFLLEQAPAPRDDSEHWLCANPGCRKPMYGMRAGAESCSNVCRAQVSRLRKAGLLPPKEPQTTAST